jgi:hypothetical protein
MVAQGFIGFYNGGYLSPILATSECKDDIPLTFEGIEGILLHPMSFWTIQGCSHGFSYSFNMGVGYLARSFQADNEV